MGATGLLTRGSEDELGAVDEDARNEASNLAVEVEVGAKDEFVAAGVDEERESVDPNPENPLNLGVSAAPV